MFLSASSKCESPDSPPLFIFVVRESVNQQDFAFFASGYTGEWSGSVRGGDKADSLLPKRLSGAPFAGAVIPRGRPPPVGVAKVIKAAAAMRTTGEGASVHEASAAASTQPFS